MTKPRLCPNCDERVEGRADKVFCSPYCKSNHHYRKNHKTGLTLFKSIDKQLKLNRSLLQHYNSAGMSTMRCQKLLDSGFDPHYFTHFWKNDKGQVYLFCYDYGFLRIKKTKGDKYLLIQWQKYMEPSNSIKA